MEKQFPQKRTDLIDLDRKSKRVVFTFDSRSYQTLLEMTEEGMYKSMADTVRESLQITYALQQQAKQGFTELTVRNPETGDEKIVVVPRLSISQ